MLRAGVLGADPAGARQAQALATACSLAGVWDPDAQLSRTVAGRFDALTYDDPRALIREVDVVAISGPVSMRAALAREAVAAGCDVLVEPGCEDLQTLHAVAVEARHPVIAVSHPVAYHPVVRALRRLLSEHRVTAARIEHLTVAGEPVEELLLDDLALALSLGRGRVGAIQAAGRRLRVGQPLGHVEALLVFEDDAIVTMSLGHAGVDRVRRVVVSTATAHVTADLHDHKIVATRTKGDRERVAQLIAVEQDDPWTEQVTAFLRAVKTRKAPQHGVAVAVECQDLTSQILKRVELVAARPGLRGAA